MFLSYHSPNIVSDFQYELAMFLDCLRKRQHYYPSHTPKGEWKKWKRSSYMLLIGSGPPYNEYDGDWTRSFSVQDDRDNIVPH